MAAQNQGKCVDVLSITGNPVDIGIPNKDSREPMLSPINFSPHVWIKIIGPSFAECIAHLVSRFSFPGFQSRIMYRTPIGPDISSTIGTLFPTSVS